MDLTIDHVHLAEQLTVLDLGDLARMPVLLRVQPPDRSGGLERPWKWSRDSKDR
jgi:hypothetical protein